MLGVLQPPAGALVMDGVRQCAAGTATATMLHDGGGSEAADDARIDGSIDAPGLAPANDKPKRPVKCVRFNDQKLTENFYIPALRVDGSGEEEDDLDDFEFEDSYSGDDLDVPDADELEDDDGAMGNNHTSIPPPEVLEDALQDAEASPDDDDGCLVELEDSDEALEDALENGVSIVEITDACEDHQASDDAVSGAETGTALGSDAPVVMVQVVEDESDDSAPLPENGTEFVLVNGHSSPDEDEDPSDNMTVPGGHCEVVPQEEVTAQVADAEVQQVAQTEAATQSAVVEAQQVTAEKATINDPDETDR